MEKEFIPIPDHLVTPDVEQFKKIATHCTNLYARKNADYGNSFDKGMDVIGPAYGLGRIYDKCNRLVTIARNGKTNVNESIEDTLTDLACYSIMMLKYLRAHNDAPTSTEPQPRE